VNAQELTALLDRLRSEPRETEWLEFKENRYDPQTLGEYLSALANSACLASRPRGYLVFGVQDGTHEVVGTQFEPHGAKAKGNQALLLWLNQGLEPNPGLDVEVLDHPTGRVVLLEVGPAAGRPVRFYGKAFIRVGSSKTELHNHPEKERALWASRTDDWSGQICEGATLADLDPEALAMAREQFRVKHPRLASDLAGWDDATFLNKTKLSVRGAVTNSALLLLGRPESSTLLSPAVAKISWILKDGQNQELDYEHFEPPFLLQVDRVLERIRNLKIRAMPSGTLFPQELDQYDPWVLREALHNALAHQDYPMGGRVNVVETPSAILVTNVGSFLPGDLDTVIQQDAPQEIYRNTLLAGAMVNLNMIDTQGGGIKRMFQKQRARFLPMPDYDLSEPGRVKVTIPGHILDEHYTQLLMERADLDLWQVIALDRVQKRQKISREAYLRLKGAGLLEGRYPNLIIAGPVARLTGQKARHIRERGLTRKYYLELIEELIREHQPIPRSEIDRLLMDKLPEVLTEEQKKTRIHSLLDQLSKHGRIVNRGSRARPAWHLADTTSK